MQKPSQHPMLRLAILVGAALMGLGALKAVLRGAKLFSQETSDLLSTIIGGAALLVIVPVLSVGLIALVRHRAADQAPIHKS